MDLIQTVEQVFRYLEPVLVAVLILRLALQRLLSRYRAFTAYIIVWLLQGVVPLLLRVSPSQNAYAIFFFVTEPFAWLFSCLVLLELFDLTFASFPGIRSAGKLLLIAAMVIAAAVSAGTAIPSLVHRADGGGLLMLYSVLERSVMLVSLILLGALVYLTIHFRLRLPRNTVIYSFTYAFLFCIRAAEALAMSEIGPSASLIVNVIAMTSEIGCLLFWSFTLTHAGMAVEVAPGPKLSPTEQRRLQAQLTGVNNMLGRLRGPRMQN